MYDVDVVQIKRFALYSPVCLLTELPLPNIINGTEAELIGASRDEAVDRHCCGVRFDIRQEDGPGSIWNKAKSKGSSSTGTQTQKNIVHCQQVQRFQKFKHKPN